jgi:anti-anti-sigma factor
VRPDAYEIAALPFPIRGDPGGSVMHALELSHQISPAGEVIVDLGGELDIATAELAVSYVKDVISRHREPVIVDLSALSFCDAGGLAALVRMAGYAEQMGCTFRISSPSLSLVKIMRITGLHRRFLTFQIPHQAVLRAEYDDCQVTTRPATTTFQAEPPDQRPCPGSWAGSPASDSK